MPSHIPNPLPCKFFLNGRCSAGEACSFSHVTNRPVCTFYLAGNCKHGTACAMLHASTINDTSPALDSEAHKDVMNEDDGILKELLNLTVSSDSDVDQMDFGMEARRIIEQRKENAPFVSNPFINTNSNDRVKLSRPHALPSYTHPSFSGMSQASHRTNMTQSQNVSTSSMTPSILPTTNNLDKKHELCAFAVIGRCRFGLACRNLHGLQCPRCLRHCLHPTDLDQNEDHLMTCMHKPVRECPEGAEEIECNICFEKVLSKPDPRFGILACSHPFCLSCIRSWRSMDKEPFIPTPHAASNARELTRSCPICGCITHFIIPSSVWISHPDEKEHLVSVYRRKLSQIPCKYFDYGRSVCPFGSSCFYEHSLPDGSPFTAPLPLIRNAVDKEERQRCLKERTLADFVEKAIMDKMQADERTRRGKQQR